MKIDKLVKWPNNDIKYVVLFNCSWLIQVLGPFVDEWIFLSGTSPHVYCSKCILVSLFSVVPQVPTSGPYMNEKTLSSALDCTKSHLVFGAVAVGASSCQKITLRNSLASQQLPLSVTIIGSPAFQVWWCCHNVTLLLSVIQITVLIMMFHSIINQFALSNMNFPFCTKSFSCLTKALVQGKYTEDDQHL